jgi:formate hydrogenlyase subunit 3/multisubunit Na+/H+ antiporter MnhD subunit
VIMATARDDKGDITPNSTSTDILNLVDGFIDQISKIGTILKGVSISALILAPIAIALSIFLLTHSSFFTILENEDEFGLVLLILLGSVIAIASVWIVAGLRQYRMISTWNKRYNDYIISKEEIQRTIASELGFTEDSED